MVRFPRPDLGPRQPEVAQVLRLTLAEAPGSSWWYTSWEKAPV